MTTPKRMRRDLECGCDSILHQHNLEEMLIDIFRYFPPLFLTVGAVKLYVGVDHW